MSHKLMLIAGALLGLLGVALGAFGAHGLKTRVEPALLDVWQTAVSYQMYHALALLVVGGLAWQWPQPGALRWAGLLWLVGVLLFSGSLYALVLSGIRPLGAITPIGGVALLAGWAALLVGVSRLPGT